MRLWGWAAVALALSVWACGSDSDGPCGTAPAGAGSGGQLGGSGHGGAANRAGSGGAPQGDAGTAPHGDAGAAGAGHANVCGPAGGYENYEDVAVGDGGAPPGDDPVGDGGASAADIPLTFVGKWKYHYICPGLEGEGTLEFHADGSGLINSWAASDSLKGDLVSGGFWKGHWAVDTEAETVALTATEFNPASSHATCELPTKPIVFRYRYVAMLHTLVLIDDSAGPVFLCGDQACTHTE